MKNDIFTKDKDGNTIYKVWFLRKEYIVNDLEKQKKLIDMEWYRELIFSYKPIIFMPILIISLIIGVIFSFTIQTVLEPKQLIAIIAVLLYFTSCLIYFYKIYKIIKE